MFTRSEPALGGPMEPDDDSTPGGPNVNGMVFLIISITTLAVFGFLFYLLSGI